MTDSLYRLHRTEHLIGESKEISKRSESIRDHSRVNLAVAVSIKQDLRCLLSARASIEVKLRLKMILSSLPYIRILTLVFLTILSARIFLDIFPFSAIIFCRAFKLAVITNYLQYLVTLICNKHIKLPGNDNSTMSWEQKGVVSSVRRAMMCDVTLSKESYSSIDSGYPAFFALV